YSVEIVNVHVWHVDGPPRSGRSRAAFGSGPDGHGGPSPASARRPAPPLTPRTVVELECGRPRAAPQMSSDSNTVSAEADLRAERMPLFAGAWLGAVALI